MTADQPLDFPDLQVGEYYLYASPKTPSLTTVSMPAGAQILSAHWDGHVLIHALADPTQPKVDREIAIYLTGSEIHWPASSLRYIGTVAYPEESSSVYSDESDHVDPILLMLHVFEHLPLQASTQQPNPEGGTSD
jgi:hypothetical protein